MCLLLFLFFSGQDSSHIFDLVFQLHSCERLSPCTSINKVENETKSRNPSYIVIHRPFHFPLLPWMDDIVQQGVLDQAYLAYLKSCGTCLSFSCFFDNICLYFGTSCSQYYIMEWFLEPETCGSTLSSWIWENSISRNMGEHSITRNMGEHSSFINIGK